MKQQKENKKLTFNLYTDDVYCSFSTDRGQLINDEIASAIQEHANNHKIKEELDIEFKTTENSTIDEREFMQALNNTCVSKIKSKKHELKRCIITGITLLIVGILMLSFDVFIEDKLSYFWFEFFNVFSWVFCWGAIEVLTIELIQIRIEINKLKRLIKSRFSFVRDTFSEPVLKKTKTLKILNTKVKNKNNKK